MTKDKISLYRKLLYIGLVDIRNFSHRASQETVNDWLPLSTQDETMAYVAELSDLLHDLAMHSAKDFENWSKWDDKYFAIGYEDFCKAFNVDKYPALIHEVVQQLKSK